MLTQKQLNIFQVFVRQPFAEFTRKQIKQISKEKSNNALALAIKQFIKEGVIKEKKVGKSSLISLDMDNDIVYCYIALANIQRIDKTIQRTVKIIKEETGKITQFYSIAIFGSFAAQEQKKTSDIDIAIFVDSGNKRNQVQAGLKSAAQKSPLPIDAHIITKDEFIEMLTSDEENLGKQIARKHLAIHNHQLFYGLVKEGMKHGFAI
jgi:predicted nucleotidyltransferase